MDKESDEIAKRLLEEASDDSSTLREFLEEGEATKKSSPPDKPDVPHPQVKRGHSPGGGKRITRSRLLLGGLGTLTAAVTSGILGREHIRRQSNDLEDVNSEFEVIQQGEIGGVQYTFRKDPSFQLVPFLQRELAFKHYNLPSLGIKRVELVAMPQVNIDWGQKPYRGLWMNTLRDQSSRYENYAILEGRRDGYWPRTLATFNTYLRKIGNRLLIYTLSYSHRETGTARLQQPLTGSLSEEQMAYVSLTYATQLDRALSDFVGKQKGTTNPNFQPITTDNVPPAVVLRPDKL